MRPFALAGVFATLLALTAAGQDAVEIKIPKPQAGDRFKVTKTEKTKNVQIAEAGGKKVTKNTEDTKDIVYFDEVITAATGDGRPVKLIRTYEKYEDKTEKAERPVPPLDTAITIAKKDGKYTFATDGKPLGGFAKTLDDEFNKPDEPTTRDVLPGKAVKPGDSWKIDTTKFIKSLGEKLSVDGEKATMSGKLLKTYKKDGKQYGVIEVRAEFPIKDLGKGAPVLKSASMKLTLTTDVCIDGTDPTEKTKTLLGFDILIETKELYLSMKADGVLTETKELMPKK